MLWGIPALAGDVHAGLALLAALLTCFNLPWLSTLDRPLLNPAHATNVLSLVPIRCIFWT